MNWKTRLAEAFGPNRLDADVLEELAQHAAATYASARAEGLDAAEAERRVDAQIAAWVSDPALLKRRPRREPAVIPPAGSTGMLAAIMQDTRYAWRLLRRAPAYTALVVATMALGIAATTVIGSVAYGVLLKPLPWADAPRLVRMYETRQGSTRRFRPVMTNLTYRAWQESPKTLDGIGAWSAERVAIAGTSAPRITIADVTPSLFPLLGARPALGRGFAAGDEQPGTPPILILSYGLWQQHFGGRLDAIGATLRLDSTTYTIVGVMPPSFMFPDRDTRAWAPFYVEPVTTPGRGGFSISMFQAIGRLRPDVTADQAAAEGTAAGRSVPDPGVVSMAVFGSNGPVEVTALPMLSALTGDVKPAILILFAAVVLLLVTATANAASLQLARATGRRRELAIRTALGAARGRLMRQTLVENVLLGLLGGVAGLLLAAVMHRILPSVLPANFPRLDDLAFDWRIQLFAVVVSIAAGLGCGLLPALHVAGNDVVPALVEDSLAPAGGGLRTRTSRVRAAIMAGQVAIASVLLIGALLLTRSFVALMSADLGYDATNVLSARLVLPDGEYTPARRLAILDDVVRRLNGTPGVAQAAYSNSIPFTGGEALSSFPVKRRDGSSVQVQTGVRQVSPGYFAAMGQRVTEGRAFTSEDDSSAAMPVIVNREFSRKYLDGRALGWTLPGSQKPNGPPGTPRPIIGIVEDTVRREVTDTPLPETYYVTSHQQAATSLQQVLSSDLNIIIRASGDPRSLVPTLRSIVTQASPGAPLESVMTMRDRVSDSLSQPRLYAVLLGTFAAFALAIAGIGLFGVLSYSVAQRAREIGVRSALGAQVRDIVALVLRQSMAIAVTGVAAGLIASAWLTSALQRFLYGVTPHDFISFGAVAVVLLVVAAIATIVPARRAARVDPVKILRA
ncbi:MAG TPA: ABC transporter permease [Vicinamibacterales bacterium]|nr:ABC transporter permease [Vicinamibacterales bacterium]